MPKRDMILPNTAQADDSPFASLSRTLESLEARLSRLSGPARRPGGKMPLPRVVDPAEPTPFSPRPGISFIDKTGKPRDLADAVSEIVMRRRMLDGIAEPASADRQTAPVRRQAPQNFTQSRRPAPVARTAALSRRFDTLAAEAETLRVDDGNYRAMAEIAAELERMRREIEDGDQAGWFDVRFEDMKQAFDRLRALIAERRDAEAIADEFEHISAALASLTEAGADRSALNAMRCELEELRHLSREAAGKPDAVGDDDRWLALEARHAARADEDTAAKVELRQELERLRESLRSLAREDQIRSVEQRWEAFEERVGNVPNEAAIVETVRAELRDVHARIEAVFSAAPIHSMEERWNALEERIEREQVAAGLRGLAERMAEMEARLANGLDVSVLDERMRSLALGIEALARRSELADGTNVRLLEERLDEISRAIAAAGAMSPPTIDMAPIERIEARVALLATRLDQIGDDSGIERFSRQIAELTESVATLAEAPAEAELARRIDALGQRFDAAFAELKPFQIDADAIEKRVGLLAEQFERAAAEIGRQAPDTAAFEDRLAGLTQRLEAAAAEPRHDDAILRSFEAQIEMLSENLTRVGSLQDDFGAEIEQRLETIEQRLDSHREMLIQAARDVAQETSQRMQDAGDRRQAEHVAELSESLRALETLSRESDGRSNQIFEAVHSTLLKIVDRLEMIEAEIVEAKPEPLVAMHDGGPADAVVAVTVDAPVELRDRAREVVAPMRLREDAGPTPSADAVDMIDAGERNRPLEPGSGVPDIGVLLERVRAAQRSKADQGEAASGAETETRAVARKAAKAASTEAGHLRFVPAGLKLDGLKTLLSRRRKVILTGVVAVIVALSALPVGKAILGAKAAHDQAPMKDDVAPRSDAALNENLDLPNAQTTNDAPAAAQPTAAGVTAPTAQLKPIAAAMAEPLPQTVAADGDALPDTSSSDVTPFDMAPVSADNKRLLERLRGDLPSSAASRPAIPKGIGPDALVGAAEAGDARAAFEIGLRLMEGHGGPSQPDHAFDWFAQAAVKGYAPAQYSLGTLYEKGKGIGQNVPAARDWYLLAAEAGNVRAMHNLAVLYATGINGRSQPETAARWFIEAANHDMRDSQFNLGILYARGSGVPKDLEQSYKWFAIVADGGDADAVAKRDEIAGLMAPEQVAAARAQVTSFTPAPRVESANDATTPADWRDKTDQTSSIEMTKAVRNIQSILIKLGYDAGTPDGRNGDKTRIAIEAFQKDNSLPVTGEIDGPLIRSLLQRKVN